MKPYVIIFENGFELIVLVKPIEEVKKSSKDFLYYSKDGITSCKGLSYTTRKATEEEISIENKRIQGVKDEYKKVSSYNKKVTRYNSALSKSRNQEEFMNVANHLR